LETTENSILGDAQQRKEAWFFHFRLWSVLYWGPGTLGVLAAGLAAAQDLTGEYAAVFALVSSLCFAFIGFANPQNRASGYIQAWRIVDDALLTYRYQDGDPAGVIEAIKHGEKVISRSDTSAPQSSAPQRRDPAAPS
jgi:hypothetical protein